jgi:hypothetical protein
MSSTDFSINDKVNLLNKYLTAFKNIQYMPFFYKIMAMLPIDIYDLLLGDNHITISGFPASESFNIILNILFFDINILYEFLYDPKYKTKTENVVTLLGGNEFKNTIINDTQKIYSNNEQILGVINIINNNKNNILVDELIKIYPHYNLEITNYFKETKFLSIINFIKILTILLNKEYSVKNDILNVLMYIIEQNLQNIKQCVNIKNNLNDNPTDYNIIIDKLDNLLNDYSSDSVLTFIKLRSDNGEDYNRRFNYTLYGKEINQKIMKIDENGKITNEYKKYKKNKIMKLNYNDDDFQYYKKINNEMLPNDDNNFKQSFSTSYPNSNIGQQNYMIDENDYKYTYILGPLSEIYDFNLTNKEISDKLDVVINSLIKQKPVLIIGYGASGAGKTSTLIYFNKGSDNNSKNGILVHLCNRMAKEHNFNKIKLKCREFYVPENKTTPDIRYFPEKKEDYIEFKYDDDNNIFKLNTLDENRQYRYQNKYTEKSYPELETIYTENSSLGELIINLIDNDRFVAATTNNPNSSRSHSLIFVTLTKIIKDNNGKDIEYETTIIIGDFAGVENLFDCESDEFKEKFYNVNRDDSQLDDSKKNKINEKISTLKKELEDEINNNQEYLSTKKELDSLTSKKNPSSKEKVMINSLKQKLENEINTKQKFLEDEIKKAEKILNSFNKTEYYHKYPIQPYYDTSQKEYSKYTLITDDILNIIFDDKTKNEYKNKGLKVFNFNPGFKHDMLTTDYNTNTEKYINYIIEQGVSKQNIIESFKNIYNATNKSISKNSSYDPKDTELIIFKSISGIRFEKNFVYKDMINLIQDGSKNILKYIDDIFRIRPTEIYKYILYFTEKFNTLKDKYDKTGEEQFKKKQHLNYGKEVCLIRRNEGVFINDTLNNIRDLINYIMIEKNKYKLSLSPPFVNECLNYYCDKDTCFELKKQDIYNTYNDRLNENKIVINVKNNTPFKSIIFNVIVEELGIKVKDIIISVFCVFNISKAANNPPPVPYISINKLKYLYFHKLYDEFIQELTKYNCYQDDSLKSEVYNKECLLLNYDKQKIKNITTSNYFKEIITSKNFINIDNFKNNKKFQDINITVKNLFNLFDNFNSASAVGTLEFVDSLSKYNTITNICNKKDFTETQNNTFDKTFN